jgi:hypothetical protein
MILVAGLAVAGILGIAAAFYFSMHPGSSRARAAAGSSGPKGPGGSRPSRAGSPTGSQAGPASPARSAGSARSAGRAGSAGSPGAPTVERTGSSTVLDFTGPQRVLEDSGSLVAGRRSGPGDYRDGAPDEAAPDRGVASRSSLEAEADDAAGAPRSRRRVAWRKGTDVDEELWPVEAFGGVSDEQFWDDLAADSPLATTARAAHPGNGAGKRPPEAGRVADMRLADARPAGDLGRGTAPRAGGNLGSGSAARAAADSAGTHPQPRVGPDDRTAIQPAAAAAQPAPAGTYPVRTRYQPDEDPLTSPAYSLRPKGAVDGRPRYSSPGVNGGGAARGRPDPAQPRAGWPDPDRFADPLRPDGSRPGTPASTGPVTAPAYQEGPRPADGSSGTIPYAPRHPRQPYPESFHSVSAPPYGGQHRYGLPAGQAGPAGEPRRAAGGWDPGRPAGGGESRGPRPAYQPGGGYRPPYDPRGYDRR